MKRRLVTWLGAITLLLVAACTTLQNSASRDPMRCERDPKCKDKRDRSADCATQCVDDPACMDRCRTVSGQR